MPRYFTLQQTNQALKEIRPWMHEVMQIRERILAHQPDLWNLIQKSAGNGGNPELNKLVFDFERFDLLIHKIQDAGALIKDINIGLLDFSALKDGREVYLCWQHGEGDIAYWHEITDGYAGRQPIKTF
jgi:hypothetical protein